MAERDAKLLAALRSVAGLTGGVYDGLVPDAIPADGKWVRPYAVLWAGAGGDVPIQRDLTGLADLGVSDWRPQVTVVGSNAGACRDAAAAVLAKLANLSIGNGYLKPDSTFNVQLAPIPDTTTTPARCFLPLQFRLLTTI